VLNVARSNGWVAALNGETSDPIEYCYSFRKILHECIDKGVDAGDVFARAGVHSLPFVESEIPFCPEDSDSE
jgi:hypothetical protein